MRDGLCEKVVELAERSIITQRDMIELNRLLQQLASSIQTLEARIVALEGKK